MPELGESPETLCAPKHHFCIAIIGRAVLPAFLISLVKMLYLVIGTTLQDRILIAQKLTKLLILSHCQIGRGSILLDIAVYNLRGGA